MVLLEALRVKVHALLSTKTPWSLVHVDFTAPISGVVYLVLVDYTKIILMSLTETAATIIDLDSIFTRHAFPETLVSDSGPLPAQPMSPMIKLSIRAFKRALSEARAEGEMGEVIRKPQQTYGTTPHSMLSDKWSAELQIQEFEP
ncbi:unnamed protein product [Hymenolepis diminuta]|uniref:Integrase catalytic domain-containing protein n=1 Tax=Hymenolepis diminuta TaxID=6216 RepID=A0A564Z334_HYMDI|nr:unnamed protein product [Hymenolepis diminuta]